jgi:hypothetical protein
MRLSASLSAMPSAMRRMFSGECTLSPSNMEHDNCSASRRATVDFPDPDTPITTTVTADITAE